MNSSFPIFLVALRMDFGFLSVFLLVKKMGTFPFLSSDLCFPCSWLSRLVRFVLVAVGHLRCT